MKKLNKAMKKVDEKYVTVETLTNAEKRTTYGGGSSDGGDVVMYGVPPVTEKYGVPPVTKYGVPPILKYGVPVTKYGVPPITAKYGVPSAEK